MLNFAARPLMHPHTTHHPLEGLQSYHHSTSVCPIPSRRSNSYDWQRPISEGSYKPSHPPSRIPSTSFVKPGLQTPPPDMTNESVGPLLPPSYGQQQFEPQVGRGLPGPLEIFRIPSEDPYPSLFPSKRRESPPLSRRNSVAQQQRPREEQPTRRRRSSTSNAGASLTVPSTVNGSKANLAEFASQVSTCIFFYIDTLSNYIYQITCLLWFESSTMLQRIAEPTTTLIPQAPLASDATPSLGFRKWVTTILSTTQVSQNVILLALLFIYRLKKLNPTVKGKPGSEFRLLTVALMLGNKCMFPPSLERNFFAVQ